MADTRKPQTGGAPGAPINENATNDKIKEKARRQCVRCGSTFMDHENMGAWRCAQHWGAIVDGRWTCCNLATNATSIDDFHATMRTGANLGCVPSDHTFAGVTYVDAAQGRRLMLDTEYLSRKRHIISSAVSDMANNRKLVYRYDKRMVDDLKYVMGLHVVAAGNPAMAKHRVRGSLCRNRGLIAEMLGRI